MEVWPSSFEEFIAVPPLTFPHGAAFTNTDAAGPHKPVAEAKNIDNKEPQSYTTAPEIQSRRLYTTHLQYSQTAIAQEPAHAAVQIPEIVSKPDPLEDTEVRDPVSLTEPSNLRFQEPQPSEVAIVKPNPELVEGAAEEACEYTETTTSESEASPFYEGEALSGAVESPSAASRDSLHLPQASDYPSAQTRSEGLLQTVQALEETGSSAATDSCSPLSHSYGEIQAIDMPRRDPRSLTVTLKYRSESAEPAEAAGASPESSSTLDEAASPPSATQTMTAQTRAATSNEAPILPPQPGANMEKFAPGLYARERNSRRAATKAFREPTTPKKAQPEVPSQELAVKLVISPKPKKEARPVKRKAAESKAAAQKRRKASEVSSKDQRPARDPITIEQLLSLARSQADEGQQRPLRDQETDEAFAHEVRENLKIQVKARRADMGKRQAVRILDLLELAQHPSEDDALFLTTAEATAEVAQGHFTKRIIVTTDQQRVPLQTVDEFLGEYYDDDSLVWIQDPEVRPTKKAPITRQVKISQVKERFASESTNKPWNLLELATHCDDGLRPSFLNTEDCRLLTKLKIPESHAGPEARRRTYLPGYKEVEKWALVAEAGALTEPHQDSHGYSTFITVNMGLVGFGWLSNPSKADRDAWRRNPSNFRGGQWRYIVLKPGQTVYFAAGTVHFVFRLPAAGNTLAFGGHILRCSNIVHWVRTLLEERDQKEVTNEDLTDSAPGYLARVEKFVNQAKVNGTAHKWGGDDSIEEFLRLKKEFLSRRQK